MSSPVKAGQTVTPSVAIQRSSLFTCEMPMDFVGKTFGYVFDYLLGSDAILTLGIYRCVPHLAPPPPPISSPASPSTPFASPCHAAATVTSPLSSPMMKRERASSRIELPETERPVPYGFAYVNPAPHDIMTGTDLIYVLAHKQPYWIASSRQDYL